MMDRQSSGSNGRSSSSAVLTMEEVMRNLKADVQVLTERQNQQKQQLRKVNDGINDAEGAAASLASRREEEGVKFCFFQEMRDWVQDLIDCITTKEPLVEELERGMAEAYSSHAERVREERAKKGAEALREALGAWCAARWDVGLTNRT